MKKRILALAMAIAMLVGVMPVSAFAEDTQTSTVTEIATVADLQAFASAVNDGETYAGKTVKLTADIDLANIQWQPIGGDSVYFAGEFDGNGKTISNLTNTQDISRKGLFGLVEKCYIHDLTLKNVKFSGDTTGARIGALAGNLQYYNVIENVTVDGLDYDLNDTDGLIGGLAGYSWTSYVKNCVVKNADMNISSSANSAVGGMIAYGRGVADARTNFPYEAQIASADYHGESVWNYCDSKVEDVTATLSGTVSFGGFLGADTYNHWRNYAKNNTVTDLSVTCAAGDGVYTVGGFMSGQYGGYDPAALYNNSVAGTITSSGTNTASTFGGFIGYKGGRPGGVTGCTANVNIDVAAGDVGGFCGETQQYFAHEYKFDGCTATGDVKTEEGTAGGFIANIQHGGDGSALNVTVTGCTVSGDVNGTAANAVIGNTNDKKNGTSTGGDVRVNNNIVADDVTVNNAAVTDENMYGGQTPLFPITIELRYYRKNNNGTYNINFHKAPVQVFPKDTTVSEELAKQNMPRGYVLDESVNKYEIVDGEHCKVFVEPDEEITINLKYFKKSDSGIYSVQFYTTEVEVYANDTHMPKELAEKHLPRGYVLNEDETINTYKIRNEGGKKYCPVFVDPDEEITIDLEYWTKGDSEYYSTTFYTTQVKVFANDTHMPKELAEEHLPRGYVLNEDETINTYKIRTEDGKKYCPVFVDPIVYSITYNLDGGALGEDVTNPTTYTVASKTIVLNNPTKDGYKFLGWAEGDGDPMLEAKIETGSTGDKTFTAMWEKHQLKTVIVNFNDADGHVVADSCTLLPEGIVNLPEALNKEVEGKKLVSWERDGENYAVGAEFTFDAAAALVSDNFNSAGEGYLTFTAVMEDVIPEPTLKQIVVAYKNADDEVVAAGFDFTEDLEWFTVADALLPECEVEGYELAGWTLNADTISKGQKITWADAAAMVGDNFTADGVAYWTFYANMEEIVPEAPATKQIFVKFVDDEGNHVWAAGKTVEVPADATSFNTSLAQDQVPEGYYIAIVGDMVIGGEYGDEVEIVVREIPAETKQIFVKFVDDEGNHVWTAGKTVEVPADATSFNTSLAQDQVPEGYYIAIVGDMVIGGEYGDEVEIVVREIPVETKQIFVKFVDREGNFVWAAGKTIVVPADATYVNTSLTEDQLPEGYQIAIVGDMVIGGEYGDEIEVVVEKIEVEVATKQIFVSYWAGEEHIWSCTKTLVVPADATYVNTSKLEEIPVGYKLVLVGDLPFEAYTTEVKDELHVQVRHVHVVETVDGYAAGCLTPGLTDGTKCAVCGEVLTAQEVIPALGHDWVSMWNGYYCTRCGETHYTYVAPEVAPNANNPVVTLKYLNTQDHIAYIKGYEDATIRPNNTITRAEVATIFYRLLTDEARAAFETAVNGFSDVNAKDWFNVAVSTLDNAGIIQDVKGGKFRPNEPITRAELFVMAAQFVQLTGGKVPVTYIPDVADDHWAADEIKLLVFADLLKGYEDGSIRPDNTLTRAEAITVINRMLKRAITEEALPEVMVTFKDCTAADWFYEAVQEAVNGHEYIRSTDKVEGYDYNYEIWTSLK